MCPVATSAPGHPSHELSREFRRALGAKSLSRQVLKESTSVKEPRAFQVSSAKCQRCTSTCDFCVVRASKTVHTHTDTHTKKWSLCIWLCGTSHVRQVGLVYRTADGPNINVLCAPSCSHHALSACRSLSVARFVALLLAYWIVSGCTGGCRFDSCSQRSV